MFIETEATPNPNLEISARLPRPAARHARHQRRRGAGQSPLAQALFAIDGVSSGASFFGSNFISITKSGGDWANLKPVVLGAIMEHFVSGEPLLIGEFMAPPKATAGSSSRATTPRPS